jgi:hypothetical protein
MNVPTIRIDICIYYILMSVLLVMLWMQGSQIKALKTEVDFVRRSLDNSIVMDTKQWEKEEDEKLAVDPQ